MGKIISIIQNKGGAAKTTTTVNALGAFLELGYKAIACDMDKDKPDAIKWSKLGDFFTDKVVPLYDDVPTQKLNEYRDEYDFILLDTPPNAQSAALKAIMLCDFIVVPCAPSELDISSLADAAGMATMANKPFMYLASKITKNTISSRALLKDLNKSGLNSKSTIYHSVEMSNAIAKGTWIGELKPNHINHIEYRKLAKELINRIGD
jgi:chromosome partitioning protein